LIWRCVEDAQLAEEADKLAQRLVAMPVAALVETRRAMDRAEQLSLDEALSEEAAIQARLGRSHDYQEGVAAFGAKRAPVFTDR
ncbi:MAG TPA: enoyl-CoA hydratase-related protein, partial [Albitalea sp.]|nr:enoyl-CoA hydratase-related protein [Albitalea sp.]